MSQPVVTVEEPIALRERRRAPEAAGAAELRATTPAQRLRELEALIGRARAPGPPPHEDGADAARARWVRLRAAQPCVAAPLRSRALRDWPSPIYDIHDTALRSALDAVRLLLRQFDDQGMVIGGVAASILGRPRLTRDIDVTLLLDLSDLHVLVLAASAFNITPHIEESVELARQSRVLLLQHEPTGIAIDLSLSSMPFDAEAIARASVRDLQGVKVRLPTPEDLIVYKAVSHRDQDLQDIYNIIQANPGLDVARVRFWAAQFAETLGMPELWEDIARWL
ncbi:MAG: nucleotidyltransferase [Chloroflexota bacterium]|nr:MAG: hypothetical protein DIU80_15275 [Chloroflexota bacterium]